MFVIEIIRTAPLLLFAYVLYSWKSKRMSAQHEFNYDQIYDAVIIPGGGLDPVTKQPHRWVLSRLDAALKYKNRTKHFVVLSRGSTHKPPPLDDRGFPITEAAASAKYLRKNGVTDNGQILLDTWSLDTIGNAYFARCVICQPLSLKRICVITNAFHMPRTRIIFDWVFTKLEPWDAILTYQTVPDFGMTSEQSVSRKEKEQASLEALTNITIPRYDTIGKLTAFVLLEHGAYNARSSINYTTTVDSFSHKHQKYNSVLSTY